MISIKELLKKYNLEIIICLVFIFVMILFTISSKTKNDLNKIRIKEKARNYKQIKDISEANKANESVKENNDFDSSFKPMKIINGNNDLYENLNTNEKDLTELFNHFANDNGLANTEEIEFIEKHEDEMDSLATYYYFYFKGEKLSDTEITLKDYDGTYSIQYGFTPYSYES